MKGLEALVSLELNTCETADQKEWAYNIIEKELKALEIIKEKRVWVDALIVMSLKEYNTYCKDVWNTPELTQEEYNLLKEVLL